MNLMEKGGKRLNESDAESRRGEIYISDRNRKR